MYIFEPCIRVKTRAICIIASREFAYGIQVRARAHKDSYVTFILGEYFPSFRKIFWYLRIPALPTHRQTDTHASTHIYDAGGGGWEGRGRLYGA